MNDPQMKAMMDANPQMKAQMENAMKMMAGGDMSAMIPKGMMIELKDGNALTKMDGGMMANMEVLYLKDKDASYHLDRQNKTFSVLGGTKTEQPAKEPSTTTPPKVTKTSETTKILGYTCTKYLVELQQGTHNVTQIIWATTDIKDIDFKSMSKHKMSRDQSFYYEGIDGVPLRTEVKTAQGTMSMEATEIKRGNVNSADFVIPPDYKETQGMFGKY